ncbi:predicted protein, partial [Postia placenta Mad-698-R]
LFWTQRGREWAITKPGEFSEEVIHLHAVARPAGYLLDKMRRLLHDQYKLIEETLAPITQTVASNVSKEMILELGRIMASVRGLTIGEFKDDPRRGHFANKTANTALRPDQISHPITKTEGKQAMIEEASNIDESDDDSLELEPIMPLFLGEQTTRDASPSPRPSSTSQLWDLKVEMESKMPPFFGEEATRDASPSPGPSASQPWDLKVEMEPMMQPFFREQATRSASPSPGPSSVPQPSGLKGRTTSKLKSMLKLKPKPKGK